MSGAGTATVFSVGLSVTNAETSRLTITGGVTNGQLSPPTQGIDNEGTLTITNSTTSGNSVSWALRGGGIFNSIGATLTLLDSPVSWNTATFTFFPDNRVCFGGGGIYNDGTLMMMNGTIVGNSTAYCLDGGGGVLNYGGGAMTLFRGIRFPTTPTPELAMVRFRQWQRHRYCWYDDPGRQHRCRQYCPCLGRYQRLLYESRR